MMKVMGLVLLIMTTTVISTMRTIEGIATYSHYSPEATARKEKEMLEEQGYGPYMQGNLKIPMLLERILLESQVQLYLGCVREAIEEGYQHGGFMVGNFICGNGEERTESLVGSATG